MRRNYSKLDATLTIAGIIPASHTQTHSTEDHGLSASSQTVSSLPHILQSLLPDWGDRRAERWERWRRETGKKSRNPGRMRGAKIGVSSTDAGASIDAI
jgi:hypothetical protein